MVPVATSTIIAYTTIRQIQIYFNTNSVKVYLYLCALLKIPFNLVEIYNSMYMCNNMSGWRSWRRLGLSITLLADQVSAESVTKSFQRTSNPKTAVFFGSRPKLGGPVYHNIIVGSL